MGPGLSTRARGKLPTRLLRASTTDAAACLGGCVCTFSLRRASLNGRVVRGMGAMGWEGASDMAAVRAGAIGRLGGLATAIEMLMRGLALMLMPHSSAEFDVGRRLGGSSCECVDPQKGPTKSLSWQKCAATAFSLDDTTRAGGRHGAEKDGMDSHCSYHLYVRAEKCIEPHRRACANPPAPAGHQPRLLRRQRASRTSRPDHRPPRRLDDRTK